MRKVVIAGAAVFAGMWLTSTAAAAQGRAIGRPDGTPGLSGSRAPLDAPGADKNSSQGSGHDQSISGPKSTTTLLTQNTQLAKNLSSFFPDGTDLMAQANGFKNLGQFVAAVHVSHNLKIGFTDLKCTELGTTKATSLGTTCPATVTNTDSMSLGNAIHTLKPEVDSQQAADTANREAKKDLSETKR
jgi:hypothetical protein